MVIDIQKPTKTAQQAAVGEGPQSESYSWKWKQAAEQTEKSPCFYPTFQRRIKVAVLLAARHFLKIHETL